MTAGAGILVYAFEYMMAPMIFRLRYQLVAQKAVEMCVILQVLEPLRMVDTVCRQSIIKPLILMTYLRTT